MLSDRDETLGVEKTSITDDNNTSFTSSDDGTGCNPILEVLKSSMSSLLSSGEDDVINEVPSIEVDVSSWAPIIALVSCAIINYFVFIPFLIWPAIHLILRVGI
jgi:hypothetical protein